MPVTAGDHKVHLFTQCLAHDAVVHGVVPAHTARARAARPSQRRREVRKLLPARIDRALDVLLQRIRTVELLARNVGAVEAVEQRQCRVEAPRELGRLVKLRARLRTTIGNSDQYPLDVHDFSRIRPATAGERLPMR